MGALWIATRALVDLFHLESRGKEVTDKEWATAVAMCETALALKPEARPKEKKRAFGRSVKAS